jgi:hypothetical protein
MCLATPAMFCRSGCDAPRRHDDPPMCLALPPSSGARAAMPHGAAIIRQCAWPLLPCFAAPAAMLHGATITRKYAWLLLPCSAARRCDAPRRRDYPPMCLALPPCFAAPAAMLHGATMTRQCAWHSRHLPPLDAAMPHGAAIIRQCAWHSRHVLPLGPRCSTAPRLPANMPGYSCHVPPLVLRRPTAPRLPANVPGTRAMFCRSCCDAPRRHDYPRMYLARLPYRASASAMQEQSHASGPNKSQPYFRFAPSKTRLGL